MNTKYICLAIFLLIVFYLVDQCKSSNIRSAPLNTVDSFNTILPPDYYLFPAFNHIRPVRQRGEYFYFPQLSR